jgi:transposase
MLSPDSSYSSEQVTELEQMGFTTNEAIKALKIYNDVESSATYLISERCQDQQEQQLPKKLNEQKEQEIKEDNENEQNKMDDLEMLGLTIKDVENQLLVHKSIWYYFFSSNFY